jgi:hypothetical protein
MLKASYRALNSHHFGVGLHYHYTTTGLPAYSWLNSYNFGVGLDFEFFRLKASFADWIV